MKKYLSIILVSGENKVLVRKLRFGKTWSFIRKTLKPKETWSEVVHLYALYNLNLVSVSEIKRIAGHEFEGSGDIEEFWMVLLNYIPKLPKSLFYKYMWVNKENINGLKEEDCGTDVLYYIKNILNRVNN
jgi:hypothetical protein